MEGRGSGDGRKLWRQPWETAAPVLRRQRGLETYAAHRILVTHPPLLAIHLRPGIHLQLHLLHAIDVDLLPAIQLHLLPANQLLLTVYFLLTIHLRILSVI